MVSHMINDKVQSENEGEIMQKMINGQNEGIKVEVFMGFISLLRAKMMEIWKERVAII